jgi:CRISPR-associated Csx2 family protein
MSHVLITFLGKGRKEQGGYQKANYQFEGGDTRSTPFFGLALLEELSARNFAVDHLVVLGTCSSIWDALLLDEMQQNAELWYKLADQVSKGNVEECLLESIAPDVAKSLAGKKLAKRVTLRIIPFGREESEQVSILQTMAEVVEDGDTVSMDISHGFRSLPMLGYASALFLQQIKNAKIAGLYYGALEMSMQGVTPVVRLDGLLKIADWVTAISAFRVSGDYGVFSHLLPEKEDALSMQQAGFLEKTLNIAQARSHLKKVRSRFSAMSEKDPVFKLFVDELQRETDWVEENTFADRQLSAARNALRNGNYARAAALGVEAIISARVIKNGQDPLKYQNREKAREELKAECRGVQKKPHSSPERAFSELNDLRNSLAHGTRPDRNTFDQQSTLPNEEKLSKRMSELLKSISIQKTD